MLSNKLKNNSFYSPIQFELLNCLEEATDDIILKHLDSIKISRNIAKRETKCALSVDSLKRGAWKLSGENLKVIWAEFLTLN